MKRIIALLAVLAVIAALVVYVIAATAEPEKEADSLCVTVTSVQGVIEWAVHGDVKVTVGGVTETYTVSSDSPSFTVPIDTTGLSAGTTVTVKLEFVGNGEFGSKTETVSYEVGSGQQSHELKVIHDAHISDNDNLQEWFLAVSFTAYDGPETVSNLSKYGETLGTATVLVDGNFMQFTVSTADPTLRISLLDYQKASASGVLSVEINFIGNDNFQGASKKVDLSSIVITGNEYATELDIHAVVANEWDMSLENGSEWSESFVGEFMKDLKDILNKFSISNNLIYSDDFFSGSLVDDIINKAYRVIYPTAFALMAIIWLISVGKSSVSTDLWNKDSCIKPLLRLAWAVGLMSLAIPILELIFSIFHTLAATAYYDGIANGVESLFDQILAESKDWLDDSWVVGGILTFFNVVWNLPKILLYLLLEVLFGMVFYIVITIRFLKLATMQCISPFFFACAGSEKTDKHLHNFMLEYTICCAQILVAMVMYSLVTVMYANMTTGWMALQNLLGVVMYIAGIITVAGSGKFLRNLLK